LIAFSHQKTQKCRNQFLVSIHHSVRCGDDFLKDFKPSVISVEAAFLIKRFINAPFTRPIFLTEAASALAEGREFHVIETLLRLLNKFGSQACS
jgi:hypothetical protein